MWIACWFMPIWIPHDKNTLDTFELYSVLFSALTALYTGIAFGVAFYSIFKQHKIQQKQQSLQTKQLRLNVFTDSMKLVMDSPRFIECKNYILSDESDKGYNKDMSALMHATKKTSISLVIIEDILENKYKGPIDLTIINIEDIRKLYDNITFFCARMNILGNVYEDDDIGSLIFDYYARTIIKSYKKLDTFIIATNEDLNMEPYNGYTKLFIEAERRKKDKKKR